MIDLAGASRAVVEPYDALLIVSFGGPEGQDDVIPFLENVTRGRNIPRDRLEEVAEHYRLFGGRSPINDQNRGLISHLEHQLVEKGISVPVYWGNRNWRPYLADEVARMRDDGVERSAAFVTSAYDSYSGCRHYLENLAEAARKVGPGAPRIDRLRHCFDHPGFIMANADSVVGALGELPREEVPNARVVFVTHSIPVAMARASGTNGNAYVTQHEAVAKAVIAKVAERTGVRHDYDLVYCSRSGSPHTPWLEPDVNDHLAVLADKGIAAAVLAPIGFLSDHMEVAFDLDVEAMSTARELGVTTARAATVGTHPDFVETVIDLLVERAAVERGETVSRASIGEPGPVPDYPPGDCCLPS